MKRLFLIGCGRSGTTLLQSLLASHPDVISFPETHFFDKGFWQFPGPRWSCAKQLELLVQDFIEKNGYPTPAGGESEIFRRLDRRDPLKTARVLVELMDELATLRQAHAWLEKTPAHIKRVPLLMRAAPDAYLIHIIRRPEAVIPSLYRASRQWGRAKTWTEAAVQWLVSTGTTAKYMEQPRHRVVFYEDLIKDTAHETRQLIEWLGMDWHDSILEKYKETAQTLVTKEESWKANTFSSISDRNQGKTLQELPLTARYLISMFGGYERIYQAVRRSREVRDTAGVVSGTV